MSTELKLFFPKQVQDYKEASRTIRRSPIFSDFVVSKSKDFRYLTLDFKDPERYNILKDLLVGTLTNMNYEIEIITN